MPAIDPADIKHRRRVASRTLLSGSGTARQRQEQIKAESEALEQAVAIGALKKIFRQSRSRTAMYRSVWMIWYTESVQHRAPRPRS